MHTYTLSRSPPTVNPRSTADVAACDPDRSSAFASVKVHGCYAFAPPAHIILCSLKATSIL